MTSPDKPKPPKAPRRTGYGAFASATAPTAPTDGPPQAVDGHTPPPGPAPQPEPEAVREQAHPDPAGRQLAHPSELFDDAGGGQDFMDALLAGPPLDPMLDLVPLGAMVPRHYKRALDNMAFVTGRRKQDLIQQALAEFLGEQLLTKSLRRR